MSSKSAATARAPRRRASAGRGRGTIRWDRLGRVGLLALLGLVAMVAHMCVNRALKLADAATVRIHHLTGDEDRFNNWDGFVKPYAALLGVYTH